MAQGTIHQTQQQATSEAQAHLDAREDKAGSAYVIIALVDGTYTWASYVRLYAAHDASAKQQIEAKGATVVGTIIAPISYERPKHTPAYANYSKTQTTGRCQHGKLFSEDCSDCEE